MSLNCSQAQGVPTIQSIAYYPDTYESIVPLLILDPYFLMVSNCRWMNAELKTTCGHCICFILEVLVQMWREEKRSCGGSVDQHFRM